MFALVSQNGGFEYIKYEDPDIFCVQETKCTEDDLPKVGGCMGYSLNSKTSHYLVLSG